MAIGRGFKKTEAGVIPNDWDAVPLGTLCTFRTGPFGSALHKADYTTGGTPIINPMHILDGKLTPSQEMTISAHAARKLADFALSTDDIVIGRRGEMGRCAVVKEGEHGWLCGTGSMIVRPKKNTDPKFLQRVLSSPAIINKITETSVGSTMINLNQGTLRNLFVQAPGVDEQRNIAEALSDVDALIESLEVLGAKKRAVKKGALQHLLEPQSSWVEYRLGDVAQLKARIGWQGLTTAEYLETGDYQLVTGTDFRDGFIDWDNCHFVNQHRYDQDKYIQLRENDVLVTKDGTIGKVAFVDDLIKPATLNSGIFVVRPLENSFRPKFLYCILMSWLFETFLAKLSAGSTISHLYQKDFVGFSFFVPPTAEEQDTISTALLDMDLEIKLLHARLAKARRVKQGMMQELLTGRVRLV